MAGISASLAVKVERIDQRLSYLRQGAMTVLPQIEIDDLQPQTGPPQGGNLVTLHGRGFNHYMQVRFAGALAGDLKILSSNRAEVRAPAGSFGKAKVAATSQLFPGEQTDSPVDYFYTGIPTGSVNLPAEMASPVSAIARLDGAESQLLYAVTGGSFDKLDSQGRVATLTSNAARLLVADISDPVHPVIVTREFAGQTKAYHYEAPNGLSPRGFVDLTINDRQLFVAGGRKLLQFDLTLPAAPEKLAELDMAGEINALASRDDLLYVAYGRRAPVPHRPGPQAHRPRPDRRAAAGRRARPPAPGRRQPLGHPAATAPAGGAGTGQRRIPRGAPRRHPRPGRQPFVPEDLLVAPERLLVSSGKNATVQLFNLDRSDDATPVADLKLTYLVSRGDLFAGQLQLAGQTSTWPAARATCSCSTSPRG